MKKWVAVVCFVLVLMGLVIYLYGCCNPKGPEIKPFAEQKEFTNGEKDSAIGLRGTWKF